MKFYLTAIMIFALTVSSFASTYSGYITRIYTRADTSLKGLVLLTVENSATTINSRPQCSSNTGYAYAFDATTPAGMVVLTLAVTSLNAKLPVYLSGSGTCTIYSNIEDLAIIRPNTY
ncbi:MAG: hypothetical protein AB7E76_04360 [Deferribacterales bacterium]